MERDDVQRSISNRPLQNKTQSPVPEPLANDGPPGSWSKTGMLPRLSPNRTSKRGGSEPLGKCVSIGRAEGAGMAAEVPDRRREVAMDVNSVEIGNAEKALQPGGSRPGMDKVWV